MNKVVIRYAELALKGKNRHLFEKKLFDNIKRHFKPISGSKQRDRMVFDFESLDSQLIERLALTPGIRNFSKVQAAPLDLKNIQDTAKEAVIDYCQNNPDAKTFGVATRRSNKQFPFTSPELNREVGGHLFEHLGLKVDLKNPDIPVHIEITHDESFVSIGRHKGIGGLPVGSSGRGVVLLSGGIDSPVAAFSMMKRGMPVELVHCYNSSINHEFSKIEALAQQLSHYQYKVHLRMIDLETFQRHAIAHVPDRYRMIIYKRQMIRVAAHIANEIGAKALITGDSLGQVASQTLENIHAIYDVSSLPLLSPLIAYDKEEIIALGRRIGTYEISIQEYCDICSYLIAKHPETKGKRHIVADLEKNLPINDMNFTIKEARFIGGERAN
ncbi:MAG: tRNA uracil 4-sulfurtransferase ThiI [Mariprofundaceae bacterium]